MSPKKRHILKPWFVLWRFSHSNVDIWHADLCSWLKNLIFLESIYLSSLLAAAVTHDCNYFSSHKTDLFSISTSSSCPVKAKKVMMIQVQTLSGRFFFPLSKCFSTLIPSVLWPHTEPVGQTCSDAHTRSTRRYPSSCNSQQKCGEISKLGGISR